MLGAKSTMLSAICCGFLGWRSFVPTCTSFAYDRKKARHQKWDAPAQGKWYAPAQNKMRCARAVQNEIRQRRTKLDWYVYAHLILVCTCAFHFGMCKCISFSYAHFILGCMWVCESLFVGATSTNSSKFFFKRCIFNFDLKNITWSARSLEVYCWSLVNKQFRQPVQQHPRKL